MIKAECHSDDRNVEIIFDATVWFEQAKDKAIIDLASCGWGGDYPADSVAEYMADHIEKIAFMFKYLEAIQNDWTKKDCHGFECHILDEKAANVWISKNRPQITHEGEKMDKINTVNVIEYTNDHIIGLHSYPDTPEGNKAAEKRFADICKDNDVTGEDLDSCLEEGLCESSDETWRVVIFHST